jgi:hypothetical protein
MPKLLTVFATAAILIASGGVIWKAAAVPITNVGSLAPLTKSYTPFEKATYWRRCYRRGYCGYGYPYYGYGYSQPCSYYGYAYRPYGYYGYGWRPGFSISIGPR